MLRENIASTVTALLELVGFKISTPALARTHSAREHFRKFWSAGKDLDLESLIPPDPRTPIREVGVFRSPSSTRRTTALDWQCC
jgi:hypothetical protein